MPLLLSYLQAISRVSVQVAANQVDVRCSNCVYYLVDWKKNARSWKRKLRIFCRLLFGSGNKKILVVINQAKEWFSCLLLSLEIISNALFGKEHVLKNH